MRKYALILGLEPSRGARSPSLWNKAYSMHQINVKMECMDLKNEDVFFSEFTKLKKDNNFIGGCIAFPYKELACKLLGKDYVDASAWEAGAINCLYRNENGELRGCNTDGLAALKNVDEIIYNKNIRRNVSIVGFGGVGKAIYANLLEKSESLGIENIYLISRKIQKIKESEITIQVNFNERDLAFNKSELIINCTDLGGSTKTNSSIFDDIDKSKIRNQTYFFDVIYLPKDNKNILFAKDFGMKYRDGLNMNRLQAELAFNLCNKIANIDQLKTEKAMA